MSAESIPGRDLANSRALRRYYESEADPGVGHIRDFVRAWAGKHLLGDTNVLSVGIGLGSYSSIIQEASGAKVIGIDTSAENVEIANERHALIQKVSFEVVDPTGLEYREGWGDYFGGAVCIDVLTNHSPSELLYFIQGVKRVCEPESEILIITRNPVRYSESVSRIEVDGDNIGVVEGNDVFPDPTPFVVGDLTLAGGEGDGLTLTEVPFYEHSLANIQGAVAEVGLMGSLDGTVFGGPNGDEYVAFHFASWSASPMDKIPMRMAREFADKYTGLTLYITNQELLGWVLDRINKIELDEDLSVLLSKTYMLKRILQGNPLPTISQLDPRDRIIGYDQAMSRLKNIQIIPEALLKGERDTGYLALAIETRMHIYQQAAITFLQNEGIRLPRYSDLILGSVTELVLLAQAEARSRGYDCEPLLVNNFYQTGRDLGGLGLYSQDDEDSFFDDYQRLGALVRQDLISTRDDTFLEVGYPVMYESDAEEES